MWTQGDKNQMIKKNQIFFKISHRISAKNNFQLKKKRNMNKSIHCKTRLKNKYIYNAKSGERRTI